MVDMRYTQMRQEMRAAEIKKYGQKTYDAWQKHVEDTIRENKSNDAFKHNCTGYWREVAEGAQPIEENKPVLSLDEFAKLRKRK